MQFAIYLQFPQGSLTNFNRDLQGEILNVVS